jgi:superfamily I DNA and/or RNA helicase
MLQARPYIFQLKHFTCCIVDEASQILEPGLIGILASSHIDRFVLIGDYKQLPAVVVQDEAMSRVEEPCLRDIGLCDCRQSLFERLIRWEQHCGRTQFIGTLDHQGRMHPDVAQFPSSHFYADEQLLPVPLSHQQETTLDYHVAAEDDLDQALQHHRVLFLPCHDNEAALVASLLLRIHRFYGTRFDPEKTVGVIVPYRHQIGLIRHELEGSGLPDLLRISIDTVERYQGSQRDVIIYAFGVEHRYQLDFLTANTFVEEDEAHQTDKRLIDRKLNVAMTRARRQLLMIGHSGILKHNPLLREIILQYSLPHQSSSSFSIQTASSI